jgi:hypothetical protein
MHSRSATESDLETVFRCLSARMRDEYLRVPITEAAAKEAFRDWIANGQADALIEEHHTLAIIAWHLQPDGVYTSFAAVEKFFTRRSTFFSKRHIRDIQRRLGDVPVRSVSWSLRSDVPKWFGLLGFDEGIRSGESVTYTLPPPDSR